LFDVTPDNGKEGEEGGRKKKFKKKKKVQEVGEKRPTSWSLDKVPQSFTLGGSRERKA